MAKKAFLVFLISFIPCDYSLRGWLSSIATLLQQEGNTRSSAPMYGSCRLDQRLHLSLRPRDTAVVLPLSRLCRLSNSPVFLNVMYGIH